MKPMDGLHTVYHSLLGKNINLQKEVFFIPASFFKRLYIHQAIFNSYCDMINL